MIVTTQGRRGGLNGSRVGEEETRTGERGSGDNGRVGKTGKSSFFFFFCYSIKQKYFLNVAESKFNQLGDRIQVTCPKLTNHSASFCLFRETTYAESDPPKILEMLAS